MLRPCFRGGLRLLLSDGEVFFIVSGGPSVKRHFERGQGDIGGAAHQFKINRVIAPGAFGKNLVTQKRNLVGKPMVAMLHALNAAFWNLVTAAKLRFCFRHTDARTYETKFSLCRTHVPGPTQTDDWMLLSSHSVV